MRLATTQPIEKTNVTRKELSRAASELPAPCPLPLPLPPPLPPFLIPPSVTVLLLLLLSEDEPQFSNVGVDDDDVVHLPPEMPAALASPARGVPTVRG